VHGTEKCQAFSASSSSIMEPYSLGPHPDRCRANWEQISQSMPDSGVVLSHFYCESPEDLDL